VAGLLWWFGRVVSRLSGDGPITAHLDGLVASDLGACANRFAGCGVAAAAVGDAVVFDVLLKSRRPSLAVCLRMGDFAAPVAWLRTVH